MSSQPLITPSRRRRFACMLYEGMLLFGLVFIATLLFDLVTDSRHALKWRFGRQLFLFVIISIYFLSAWRLSGQTLAMKTWHIRLHNPLGGKLSYLRLIQRYVLMWVFPLIFAFGIELAARQSGLVALSSLIILAPFSNFFYTWFDPEQQFMHDRLSRTRLIDCRIPIAAS